MLVALKATPMVPWFDDHYLFSELGIFNLEEKGVFVIAEYSGKKEYTNEVDPQEILDKEKMKIFQIEVPEMVKVGTSFDISGNYYEDGDYIVMFGSMPVSVQVIDNKFVKTLTIDNAGIFTVKCFNTPSVEKQMLITV